MTLLAACPRLVFELAYEGKFSPSEGDAKCQTEIAAILGVQAEEEEAQAEDDSPSSGDEEAGSSPAAAPAAKPNPSQGQLARRERSQTLKDAILNSKRSLGDQGEFNYETYDENIAALEDARKTFLNGLNEQALGKRAKSRLDRLDAQVQAQKNRLASYLKNSGKVASTTGAPPPAESIERARKILRSPEVTPLTEPLHGALQNQASIDAATPQTRDLMLMRLEKAVETRKKARAAR